MSRPVYSSLLLSGQVGDEISAPLGPLAGFKWVVRDIDIYVIYAVAGAYFNVNDQTPTFLWWFPVPTAPIYGSWRGRQVVEQGQEVSVTANGCVVAYRVSGYNLSL